MNLEICSHCNRNRTALRCDSCEDVSCKSCVVFVDEDFFEMVALLPDDLQNRTFCMNCFNQGISERLDHYLEIVSEAKNVDIFNKNQTKETRKIKRIESPIRVANCLGKEEALLKIAFFAAERGFKTVVDVELRSNKIGEGKSYKKLVWNGSGTPVDPSIKK